MYVLTIDDMQNMFLTSYATLRNSNGFVFDTATSLTLPSGRSCDEIASEILCFTDEILDAISNSGSASVDVDNVMLNFEGSTGCKGTAVSEDRGEQSTGLNIWDGNAVAMRSVVEVAYAATTIRLPDITMVHGNGT